MLGSQPVIHIKCDKVPVKTMDNSLAEIVVVG